ncbi:unnamed protein product [Linum tenue]|uniref:Alpha/beta hydrolase fold-3 domain-containing protein n=1 Tax=Linum tenue TaxID=586396 RepID=A0AAV0Q8M7_9ROSI|nr:unnamed protein product [Linum tenue]
MPKPPAVDFDDCVGLIRVYKDGSVWRANLDNLPTATDDDDEDGSVQWKDYVFNPKNNLSLRLYKPSAAAAAAAKLPVVYNIHGGGFCIGSRTEPYHHGCCLRLAAQLRAVVVSPDYRLAPESRLPAAIEDCHSALEWLQHRAAAGDDTWLSDVADFGKVFVCGESAGGNVAHNLAVRVGSGSPELGPVKIRGYVVLSPSFGGTFAYSYPNLSNPSKPREFWKYSIPVGDTCDHPLANPFGAGTELVEPMELDPILVVSGGSDILVDRIRDYAEKLKELGKRVEYAEFEGEVHGFFTYDPESKASRSVMDLIRKFVTENSD